MKSKTNFWALLPIWVFLLVYLGTGIFFEYIFPIEGQMGFYIMPIVVAFCIALFVALIQNRKLSFDQKMQICAKGFADENIIMMIFIFLLSGAFSGIAKDIGGASNMANCLLNFIPPNLITVGLFLIASVISMATGTSVGTIAVLVPIATQTSQNGGFSPSLCIATVICGAMFGDNLSFISDTTIAATKTQGVKMKEKFNLNLKLALPATIVTIMVLFTLSLSNPIYEFQTPAFDIIKVIPYLVVLIMSLFAINVFVVLGTGIILFSIAGVITGNFSFISILNSMKSGTSQMFETIIVTILVSSICALIKENGGFNAILNRIKNVFYTKKGGMLGICILTFLTDIATANNTVAIIISSPVAKDISNEFNVEPVKTSVLLASASCITQGIIPYGAQILIATSLTGISSLEIISQLYYLFFLLISVLIFILIQKNKLKLKCS